MESYLYCNKGGLQPRRKTSAAEIKDFPNGNCPLHFAFLRFVFCCYHNLRSSNPFSSRQEGTPDKITLLFASLEFGLFSDWLRNKRYLELSHDWLPIRKMIRFLLGEPKFGIVYLKIYEILQNLSLRKKFMQFCWKYLKFRIVMLT